MIYSSATTPTDNPAHPTKKQKNERTQEVIDSIRSSLKKRAVSPPFAALRPRFA
jgi:hypothetical protein